MGIFFIIFLILIIWENRISRDYNDYHQLPHFMDENCKSREVTNDLLVVELR